MRIERGVAVGVGARSMCSSYVNGKIAQSGLGVQKAVAELLQKAVAELSHGCRTLFPQLPRPGRRQERKTLSHSLISLIRGNSMNRKVPLVLAVYCRCRIRLLQDPIYTPPFQNSWIAPEKVVAHF